MTEPRKPIFGFLWPKPDPNAPVDAAYRQVRWVRVTPRGPIRLAVLLLASVAIVVGIGLTLLAGVRLGVTGPGVLSAALFATALLLVLRGWVVGTYVTDDLVRVETTWRRTVREWSSLRAVESRRLACPWLGLPLPLPGERTFLLAEDGELVATHVYTTSPDLWLRPEAYDMARIRLDNWRQGR
jgi:hypothetical protein